MIKTILIISLLIPGVVNAEDSILDPIKTESLKLFTNNLCEFVRKKDFKSFKASYAQLDDYKVEARAKGLRTDSAWTKLQYPKFAKFPLRQTNDWQNLDGLFVFNEDRSWFVVSDLNYKQVKGKPNVFDVYVRFKSREAYYVLTIKDCTYSGERWYINQGILVECTMWWSWP
jgi:hypothetical protein